MARGVCSTVDGQLVETHYTCDHPDWCAQYQRRAVRERARAGVLRCKFSVAYSVQLAKWELGIIAQSLP